MVGFCLVGCCTLVRLIWTRDDEYITMRNIPVKEFKENLRENNTVFLSRTVIVKKDSAHSAALMPSKEVVSTQKEIANQHHIGLKKVIDTQPRK